MLVFNILPIFFSFKLVCESHWGEDKYNCEIDCVNNTGIKCGSVLYIPTGKLPIGWSWLVGFAVIVIIYVILLYSISWYIKRKIRLEELRKKREKEE